jgi:hypothetical protein
MYTYIKKNGRVGPDIMDVVTENPDMECLGIMCSSIWDWDLEVDRIEISDETAEKLGLKFDENGKCVRSFRWPKFPLPLPVPVPIMKKSLPEGVFAIAWSNLPSDFPASCYLTDERHQCDRFYSAKG